MHKQKKAVLVIFSLVIVALLVITPVSTFASGEHEGEGTEEHGFNWWQFIGKTVNAIILFGGLILLLRKPLVNLLAQKSLDIHSDIQQRENEATRTSNELEKIRQRLEKIEEEIATVKEAAEKSGEDEKKRIEELGAKEAQRILELSEAEINTKVENSIRNLKTKIADLTLDHFKKDIQTQLDQHAHEKIIEKNIERCGEIIEGK